MNPREMKTNNLASSLFILGIFSACLLSFYLFKAPNALPASSPDNQFSAVRAMDHVKHVANKPHPMGTDEHERVKDYIISELNKIGLQTSVQATTSISYEGDLNAGYVQNIIGILKGTKGNKSVLVVGHYDSQPNTLGAADDGSAVGSMLEAAKALKQSDELTNDIVFLFTDGEESGLFGAKAFIDENPLKDSVGIVLNIEARGSSGPSITYEVSSQNGWIMREYAKAVPYPIANSIAYEIYKLLPNDSDFTPFRKAGLSGFNIAFIDDFVNYHSMTDSPENLSLQSLQHHGSYILGIAKHFGMIDLTKTKSEDVVYFNPIGHYLLVYPVGLNIFLVILVSLLMISVITAGLRKNRLSIGKIFLGIAIFVGSIVLVMLLTWLLIKGLKSVYPYYSIFYSSNFYNIKDYFIVFSCLAIVIFTSIYNLFFKKISVENLLVGILFVNYVMLFFFMHYIPTGSYLAIVPLVLILTALLFCFVLNLTIDNKRWAFLLVHFVLLVPVISLLVPMIEVLFVTFGLTTIYGGVIVLIILLGYLILPINLINDKLKWTLPLLAIVLLFIKLVYGHLDSKYTKGQPLQSNVSYLLNSDTNNALWFSSNRFVDEWKLQFFKGSEFKPLSELSAFSNSKYLQKHAPIYAQELPELLVISDSIKVGVRYVCVNIKSKRKAQNCFIVINKTAQVSSIAVDGKLLSSKNFYNDINSNYYLMNYFGLNDKGLYLELKCGTPNKIELTIFESKLGLPLFEGYNQMPENIIPDKGYLSNVTLVKRTWNF
jgi:hypothetical protein